MDSNDYPANGGPPPNQHGYHVDPSSQPYPNSGDYNTNYPGYSTYQYPNYNYPPTGPADLNAPPTNYPPPPGHANYQQGSYQQDAYQQDSYQHHQYQQLDPAYHYRPPESTKMQEPAYQHPPPNLPPTQEEEPKDEALEEAARIPAIPKIPPALLDPADESEPADDADQTRTADESTNDNEGDADAENIADASEELPEGESFNFEETLMELQNFKGQHGNANVPITHPAFKRIVDTLLMNGIEDEANKRWEGQFHMLKAYKERNGDCDVPFTDAALGDWINDQRKLYAEKKSDALSKSRFEKLEEIGFEWEPPLWDKRLEELMEFKRQKGHCEVPIKLPNLGIWVVNQRFNINDMPKERVAALDAIGFIWNHNQKKRSDDAWNQKYEDLLEYIKLHGHCNVPATYRHSPLGTWVGKQREEYKKFTNKRSSQLSKYRIDKLEEVGFQWSLQQWTVIAWDDRFEVCTFYLNI